MVETVGVTCCVVLSFLSFLHEILGWPQGEGLKRAEPAVPTRAGSSRGLQLARRRRPRD